MIKKKLPLIIISVVLLIFIGVSLYIISNNNSDNSGTIPYNSPKKLAKLYVESIIKDDYSTAIKCLSLPQDSFITKEDVETYIKNKSFYKEFKEKSIKEIVEIDYNDFQFILNDKDDNTFKYNVEVNERTINDYRINEEELYIEKYKFIVPKNSKVYIDDMLVSSDFIKNSGEYEDEYVIPAIGRNKQIFKVTNKIGTKEYEIEPNEDNNNYEFIMELENKELLEKAYKFIQNAWNKMYEEYDDDNDVNKIKYLFDDKFNNEQIKGYYNKGFNNISKGTSSSSENIEFVFDSYRNGKDKNYIVSDDLIDISFGYRLEWYWHIKGYKSKVYKYMTRYSGIRLKATDDGFKIYDVLDKGLFNLANEYLKEY